MHSYYSQNPYLSATLSTSQLTIPSDRHYFPITTQFKQRPVFKASSGAEFRKISYNSNYRPFKNTGMQVKQNRPKYRQNPFKQTHLLDKNYQYQSYSTLPNYNYLREEQPISRYTKTSKTQEDGVEQIKTTNNTKNGYLKLVADVFNTHQYYQKLQKKDSRPFQPQIQQINIEADPYSKANLSYQQQQKQRQKEKNTTSKIQSNLYNSKSKIESNPYSKTQSNLYSSKSRMQPNPYTTKSRMQQNPYQKIQSKPYNYYKQDFSNKTELTKKPSNQLSNLSKKSSNSERSPTFPLKKQKSKQQQLRMRRTSSKIIQNPQQKCNNYSNINPLQQIISLEDQQNEQVISTKQTRALRALPTFGIGQHQNYSINVGNAGNAGNGRYPESIMFRGKRFYLKNVGVDDQL